jgi:hypothetical protein
MDHDGEYVGVVTDRKGDKEYDFYIGVRTIKTPKRKRSNEKRLVKGRPVPDSPNKKGTNPMNIVAAIVIAFLLIVAINSFLGLIKTIFNKENLSTLPTENQPLTEDEAYKLENWLKCSTIGVHFL